MLAPPVAFPRDDLPFPRSLPALQDAVQQALPAVQQTTQAGLERLPLLRRRSPTPSWDCPYATYRSLASSS